MLCYHNKLTTHCVRVLLLLVCLLYGLTIKAQTRVYYADSISALKAKSAVMPIYNRVVAVIYNKWATMESDRGLYQFADSLYEAALLLENQGLLPIDIYTLNVNRSELYLRRGMYGRARNLLQDIYAATNKLEDVSRDNHFPYYSNLTSYYLYLQDLDSAQIAIDSLRALAKTQKEYSNYLSNLSHLYLQQGNYQKSFEIIVAEIQKIETDSRRKYVLLSHKAYLESQMGDADSALKDITKCIDWQKDNLGTKHQDYIISLRKRAEIYQKRGDLGNAFAAYKQYVSAEKEYAINEFAVFTEQQRLDYWANKKPLISQVFSLEDHSPDFLYDVALLRRQIALMSQTDIPSIEKKLSYTSKQIATKLKKNAVAIEFIKYEKDEEYRYAALLINGSTSKKAVEFIPLWSEDSINAFRIGGKNLSSALCSGLNDDKNRVYQSSALSQFVWGKLLPHIPQGATVFFAPDGILHLLAIEYLPSVYDKGYDFRRLTSTACLIDRRNVKRRNTKALVVGGIDYNNVLPKDSGAVNSINKDAYNYLLQNGKLLHFTYLPGTKIEAECITNYLSAIDKQEDIDEETLKTIMDDYGKIHLATHGYSWHVDIPRIPYLYRDSITEDRTLLASGIALSGTNQLNRYPNRDDGLLSARELCEMDLSGVELVVASSCQSAQGRVSDEGPIGIVRGFKKAGIKTIIASLWPVDDKTTTLLMQFFYDEWREGKGKDGKGCTKTHALHLAQKRLQTIEMPPLKVRVFNPAKKVGAYKTIASDYKSPYFWAPFIIIDDI